MYIIKRFLRCLRDTAIVSCTLGIVSGCSDESWWVNNNTGQLALEIEVDNTFRYPDGAMVGGVAFIKPEVKDVSLAMRSVIGDFSHVWPSFDDFPQDDLYFVGTYHLEAFYGAGQEGFDMPYYETNLNVDILTSETTNRKLTLTPVSSADRVNFGSELTDYLTSVTAYLHSDDGDYFKVIPGETRMLYLLPGPTSLSLDLVMPDGKHTAFIAGRVEDAVSGVYYEYDISLDSSGDVPVVICKVNGKETRTALDDGFLAAAPPSVEAIGWNPGETYVLPEGEIPDENVSAHVTSSRQLSHLILTVSSPCLNSIGVPRRCDLLSLDANTAEILTANGLKISATETGMDVDFTDFLGSLVFLTESQALSTFSLFAEDESGRVSTPLTLTVMTTPMEIEIVSVPPVMVGAGFAEIEVTTEADDFASHVDVELCGADGKWAPTEIVSVTPKEKGRFTIRFVIPEGNADVSARILYCQEVRAEVSLSRYMPDFTLEADPFATFCSVRVNAGDPAYIAPIVRGLDIYINGKRANVLSRDTDRRVIVITNLTPSTTYSLTSTMMGNPSKDDFTPALKFTTETTPALPNTEFEHRKEGPSYESMPSGGRYSQTTVPIFNWQNSHTFETQVPREWANNNAKTFSRRSASHNTWYMQPAVFSELSDNDETSYAVCLRSVAFDPDGPIIPDYTQTGTPYLKYSPIIPDIAYRAAGKLFLGSYSFDVSTMQETYNDVVDWRSRPMSLNGYYKYNPSSADTSDTGLAIVEVYGMVDGERRVIGSGTAHLPVANSYTAFKTSVTYQYFGVKATGLKVMFASSRSIGTIAEETASIVTVPDPVTASSIGSTLWLDHVTLAY